MSRKQNLYYSWTNNSCCLCMEMITFATMQVTIDYLYSQFDKYNQQCFESALRKPVIKVSNARRQLGVFVGTKPLPTIKVSNYYDRCEQDYLNTLVHEMIHMYIYEKGIKDTSPHGAVFRRMMSDINRQTGLHMSVSVRTQQWQPSRVKVKMRYVLFLEMADGRLFTSVVSPSYVRLLDRKSGGLGKKFARHKWLYTNDQYVSGYSSVRTLKGRLMKPADYSAKLAEMVSKSKSLQIF